MRQIHGANPLASQYHTTGPLNRRIRTHQLYSETPDRLDAECLTGLALTGWEATLDVGCGSGRTLRSILQSGHRGVLVGLDASQAMLAEAREGVGGQVLWVRSRAEELPFGDGQFDRLIARHMLYYVQDAPLALRGFARAMKPGAILLVATNGRQFLPRMNELRQEFCRAFGLPPGGRDSDAFSVEMAREILPTVFPSVQERLLKNALRIPEPGPVVDYLTTLSLPGEAPYTSEMLRWLESRVSERIGQWGGTWRGPKPVGVFVCRR